MKKIVEKLSQEEKYELFDILQMEIFGYSLEDKMLSLEGQVEELRDLNDVKSEIIEERLHRVC